MPSHTYKTERLCRTNVCPYAQPFNGILPGTTRVGRYTHTFNGRMSGTTWVSRYQKGKTNLDFTEARDSEWQWHQLQVCTSLQTDNHANTSPLSFLQAGCPSCRPTNSVKALKGRPLPEEIFTHSRQFWSSYILYQLHLLRSIASSLFNLRAWQPFSTTSLPVLFGLGPCTSYSIHFFAQSSSSFRNACPYTIDKLTKSNV